MKNAIDRIRSRGDVLRGKGNMAFATTPRVWYASVNDDTIPKEKPCQNFEIHPFSVPTPCHS